MILEFELARENLEVNNKDNRVFIPLGNLMFLKLAYLPFEASLLGQIFVLIFRDLKIPRNRCTGTGSVPVHVKC